MHNETEPMFLSFFIALGPFLLLAARKPSAHRSLIAFTAWWNLAHAAVMTIETVQAWDRGVHRDFRDVVIVAVIGLILLALLAPARPTAGKLQKSRLPLELRPERPASRRSRITTRVGTACYHHQMDLSNGYESVSSSNASTCTYFPG